MKEVFTVCITSGEYEDCHTSCDILYQEVGGSFLSHLECASERIERSPLLESFLRLGSVERSRGILCFRS